VALVRVLLNDLHDLPHLSQQHLEIPSLHLYYSAVWIIST
jgi:hypothetical protein